MKSKVWNSIIVATLMSVLGLAGAVSLAPAISVKAAPSMVMPESKAKKLEGTWRVQVTIHDCQTGAALRTFPAFLTFAQGGTLVETTTGFSPALRTPGHGFWEHTGGKTFTATSEAFLFNPAGVWTGTQTLTQAIEMGNDSDEFSSNASIKIIDTNGNPISTGCATAVAHRME